MGNDTVVGGTGSATIMGIAGDDVVQAARKGGTIFTGAGNETISLDRGKDFVEFVAGQSGGQDVISGFNAKTDGIILSGYGSNAISGALASAHAVAGGFAFSLTDGTQITVLGTSTLPATSFKLG